jgi:hypothetical protein
VVERLAVDLPDIVTKCLGKSLTQIIQLVESGELFGFQSPYESVRTLVRLALYGWELSCADIPISLKVRNRSYLSKQEVTELEHRLEDALTLSRGSKVITVPVKNKAFISSGLYRTS